MKIKIPKQQLMQYLTGGRTNLIFLDDLPDLIELDTDTNAELDEYFCKKCSAKRTNTQNNSLHLLFQQVSDDCLAKGITMDKLLKHGVSVECTPENIKWLWKKIQTYLYGKKSTTELKKTGEIDIVYRNFNKLLIDRTQGEICLPPFPSLEVEKEKLGKIEYPQEDYSPDKIPF